jgi:hypothetical protein
MPKELTSFDHLKAASIFLYGPPMPGQGYATRQTLPADCCAALCPATPQLHADKGDEIPASHGLLKDAHDPMPGP